MNLNARSDDARDIEEWLNIAICCDKLYTPCLSLTADDDDIRIDNLEDMALYDLKRRVAGRSLGKKIYDANELDMVLGVPYEELNDFELPIPE